jgi:hypothetical protein
VKSLSTLFNDRKKQIGINMVDLMMWLVIAALLLAAAIQGIAYYQKTAYLYQMNAEVEMVAGKITAVAATEGTVITKELVGRVVAEENAARSGDQIEVTAGELAAYASGGADAGSYGFERTLVAAATTGGQSQYIKATHEAVPDRESAYFFSHTASYTAGVNVVDSGVLTTPVAPEGTPSGEPTIPAPEPEIVIPANYNWESATSAGTGWRSVASSADGKHLIGGRASGTSVYVSHDYGVSWTPHVLDGVSLGTARAMVDISDDGLTIVATASNSWDIYTSRNGGTDWTKSDSKGIGGWWSISMSADGQKMIAADQGFSKTPGTNLPSDGRIVTSNDYGTTWTDNAALGDGKWRVASISPDGGTMVAGGMNGMGLNVSIDGGLSWSKTLVSETPAQFTGVDFSTDGRRIIAVSEGIAPDGKASYTGKSYYSSDRGLTWNETSAGPNLWTNAAMSADGQRIVIIAHLDFVYASTDGGATWVKQESLGTSGWPKVDMSADGKQIITAQHDGTIKIGKLAE